MPDFPLFVLGYPGNYGGACTELWHVLKLWRSRGVEVHLIPTWGAADPQQRKRCDSIGCITHQANPNRDELAAIDGLAGGVVVSFCNRAFLAELQYFCKMRCRIVWIGCMNWLFEQEKRLYPLFGVFDAYAFQSRFQLETLSPQLELYGADPKTFFRIPGAFDPDEFGYEPLKHRPGEPFVAGRVSRASHEKFSTNTWPILGRVNYQPFRYRVLGWDDACSRVIGQPPGYAECYPPQSQPAGEFLRGLHCYCQLNGTATENWPRTGLEAMAAGVPIVVEHRGGWPAMIEHRTSGFVCRTDQELAHWVAAMAYDDDLRLQIAAAARARLVETLADPQEIWAGWRRLFESLPKKAPKRPRKGAKGRGKKWFKQQLAKMGV